MTDAQKTLIRNHFCLLQGREEALGLMFYGRLLYIAPDLAPLFESTDIRQQGKKLFRTLGVVVSALDKLETLDAHLRELGRNHRRRGVSDAHYELVGAALLWTLEHSLMPASAFKWSYELAFAWTLAYKAVADVMKAG